MQELRTEGKITTLLVKIRRRGKKQVKCPFKPASFGSFLQQRSSVCGSENVHIGQPSCHRQLQHWRGAAQYKLIAFRAVENTWEPKKTMS